MPSTAQFLPRSVLPFASRAVRTVPSVPSVARSSSPKLKLKITSFSDSGACASPYQSPMASSATYVADTPLSPSTAPIVAETPRPIADAGTFTATKFHAPAVTVVDFSPEPVAEHTTCQPSSPARSRRASTTAAEDCLSPKANRTRRPGVAGSSVGTKSAKPAVTFSAVAETVAPPTFTDAVEPSSSSSSERPLHATIEGSAEPSPEESAISGRRPSVIVDSQFAR